MEKEFAVNQETDKIYEGKPSKYVKFPHLQKLKEEIEQVPAGSKKYWQLRCIYLEKTIDETYSVFERENCREFYLMLVNKQP
jgi:NTP pyrophosphatase (non-canonical NTP hydrolase)